jgi:hypothetical protein
VDEPTWDVRLHRRSTPTDHPPLPT